MSARELLRPEILELEPYVSARSRAVRDELLLDANESPWQPSLAEAGDLHRYPEPQPEALKTRVARYLGVEPAAVMLSRGSDEALDLLIRAFCRSGEDAIGIFPPTFGMYEVSARIHGARVLAMPRTGPALAFPEDAIEQLGGEKPKILFLCSPNNPTGEALAIEQIEAICAAVAGDSLVVVDEAYQEYAQGESAISLLGRHDNLVVLRTFSKAHALAAIRVGIAIGDPELIATLRRVLPPYPLAKPSIALALAALEPSVLAQTQRRVEIVRTERERMRERLTRDARVERILPSDANFLLLYSEQASTLFDALEAAQIRIRRFSGLPGWLRLSIGRPEDNQRVCAALGLAQTESAGAG